MPSEKRDSNESQRDSNEPQRDSNELTTRFRFPHPNNADEDGFLAVGGDLKPGTLLLAYGNGIFPWTTRPVTWWSRRRSVLWKGRRAAGMVMAAVGARRG